jgi:hypothetical protein
MDMKPAEGVTPPSPSAEHSSIREAPPAAASFTLAKDAAQTSNIFSFSIANKPARNNRGADYKVSE